MRTHARYNTGFTLIEVMIVVAILALLAAIAIPNYTEYVTRSKRTEGQILLSEVAARQERFFAQNNRYVTDPDEIALLGFPKIANKRIVSDNGYYEVAVSSTAGDGGYTLTAIQSIGDADCGNLMLDALGVKEKTGTKDVNLCWR